MLTLKCNEIYTNIWDCFDLRGWGGRDTYLVKIFLGFMRLGEEIIIRNERLSKSTLASWATYSTPPFTFKMFVLISHLEYWENNTNSNVKPFNLWNRYLVIWCIANTVKIFICIQEANIFGTFKNKLCMNDAVSDSVFDVGSLHGACTLDTPPNCILFKIPNASCILIAAFAVGISCWSQSYALSDREVCRGRKFTKIVLDIESAIWIQVTPPPPPFCATAR